jgi:hypothetical protein
MQNDKVNNREEKIRQQNINKALFVKIADKLFVQRAGVIIIKQHKAAQKNKGRRTIFHKNINKVVQPIVI